MGQGQGARASGMGSRASRRRHEDPHLEGEDPGVEEGRVAAQWEERLRDADEGEAGRAAVRAQVHLQPRPVPGCQHHRHHAHLDGDAARSKDEGCTGHRWGPSTLAPFRSQRAWTRPWTGPETCIRNPVHVLTVNRDKATCAGCADGGAQGGAGAPGPGGRRQKTAACARPRPRGSGRRRARGGRR